MHTSPQNSTHYITIYIYICIYSYMLCTLHCCFFSSSTTYQISNHHHIRDSFQYGKEPKEQNESKYAETLGSQLLDLALSEN